MLCRKKNKYLYLTTNHCRARRAHPLFSHGVAMMSSLRSGTENTPYTRNPRLNQHELQQKALFRHVGHPLAKRFFKADGIEASNLCRYSFWPSTPIAFFPAFPWADFGLAFALPSGGSFCFGRTDPAEGAALGEGTDAMDASQAPGRFLDPADPTAPRAASSRAAGRFFAPAEPEGPVAAFFLETFCLEAGRFLISSGRSAPSAGGACRASCRHFNCDSTVGASEAPERAAPNCTSTRGASSKANIAAWIPVPQTGLAPLAHSVPQAQPAQQKVLARCRPATATDSIGSQPVMILPQRTLIQSEPTPLRPRQQTISPRFAYTHPTCQWHPPCHPRPRDDATEIAARLPRNAPAGSQAEYTTQIPEEILLLYSGCSGCSVRF